MNHKNTVEDFVSILKERILSHQFITATLGNYKGQDKELKNIVIKKIRIKEEEKLNFILKYKTKDITKNLDLFEGINEVKNLLNTGFNIGNLFNTDQDIQFERLPNNKTRIRFSAPSKTSIPDEQHDHQKRRLIKPSNATYLVDLGIADREGNIFKKSQDKYRQINHYIEILSTLLENLTEDKTINVADMGSGKGYLTFALYDYLTNVLKKSAHVTGVEFRKDMVDLCNNIAQKTEFQNLQFVEGTIENYPISNIDMLIALHACDTATDDAIAKGIEAGAELIVVAPCCHKQVRKSMERSKQNNEIDFLTRHGIFLERQAEMVTDGIRAMILEYFGYKTKIFQFVSDAHTPKNVMITAQKQKKKNQDKEAILASIESSMAYFGIDYHHLKQKLGL